VNGDAGNGAVSAGGGGIINLSSSLTLIESTIDGNTTGAGGNGENVTSGNGAGIYNGNNGTSLVAVDTTISDNATGPGGLGGTGAGTGTDGADGPRGNGGGLALFGGPGNVYTMSNCTINGNTARLGGGIYLNQDASVALTNCTLSSNRATESGGGIGLIGSGTEASLNHVTVAYNTADLDNDGSGDGGGFYTVGTFAMTNTLIAKNYDKGNENPDCSGLVVSGDYNLLGIGDSAGCAFTPQPHDQVGTVGSPLNPGLALNLEDNGGPTLTHVLKSNSPAVDWIPLAACPLNEDQRGFSRPVDYDGDHIAQCDIGAVEMRESYTLAIVLAGDGTGNISSNPAGINCGDSSSDCAAVFYEDTVITLTATAATDSSFSSWGGDASGTDNPLMITIDGDKSIEANFAENSTEWLIYLPLTQKQ
jgi:hypothetical protein